ncbi:sulfite exporter TauE/SafE family protein [Neoroseomonas soli]|uniref:Probable membrane transporter protein n=1 Tax=Neoroseomonas soli TaxID=1081025 RepID=A0A9X9WW25_9PROT|nr:sulfite exporter TauE/SafE family protein [Neoroseomonas soli]MBR0671354.1 sulfite exporter TauE/SafE family protein [Neoroseomonas soli]
MDVTSLLSPTAAVCAAMVFAVAVLRGFTGFGFALVAVPLLSLVLAPIVAVPLVLLLEVVASAQLLPKVWRQAQWRIVLMLTGGAVLGTPLGLYGLSLLPTEVMRLAIAAVVLATALLMSAGLRFRHPPGRRMAVAAGMVSGVLNGGAAMSGPPVVLFFLASPGAIAIGRASLLLYFLLADVIGAGLAAASGLVTGEVLLLTAWLLPALFVGQAIGARQFREDRQHAYRRVSILVLLAASLLSALRAAADIWG